MSKSQHDHVEQSRKDASGGQYKVKPYVELKVEPKVVEPKEVPAQKADKK